MDYKRIYNELINRGKNRIFIDNQIDIEKHHIIPVSLGGTNDKSNIVSLTIREHFFAHLLLTKFTTGTEYIKMLFAFGMMSLTSKTNSNRKINSKIFEKSKKAAKLAIKELHKNPEYINPTKGTSFFTNGKKLYRLKPDNPIILNLNLQQCSNATLGKKWFFNGEQYFILNLSEGKIKGYKMQAPAYGKPKKYSEKVCNERKKMFWFNDGIKNTKLKLDDPRVIGLKRGRFFTIQGLKNLRGGRVLNDGIKNFYFKPGEQIPDHLFPGRIKHHLLQK